jgi:hypothetical protein
VLRDRLMTMLVVRRAATAGDMDHLLQQLSQVRCGCRAVSSTVNLWVLVA